jgi:hypothetical protein
VSPDGTTWAQKYTLSPFVHGESLVVRFNPVRVNGTEVTPDPLTFKVETSLRNATAADARPVTGVESLPAPPPAAEPPLIAAGLVVLSGLVVALAVVLAIARKRKPKPLTAGEWIRLELSHTRDDFARGRWKPTEFAGWVSHLMRRYLHKRFGLTAEHRTTAELLADADAQSLWDADTRDAVEKVLRVCDAVKFAGAVPTPAECDELVERVSKLVDGWERPVNGTR